jgi:hypothetical protein
MFTRKYIVLHDCLTDLIALVFNKLERTYSSILWTYSTYRLVVMTGFEYTKQVLGPQLVCIKIAVRSE